MCLRSMAPRGGTSSSLCGCVAERKRGIESCTAPTALSLLSQTMDSVLDDCSRPAIHTPPQATHETAAPHTHTRRKKERERERRGEHENQQRKMKQGDKRERGEEIHQSSWKTAKRRNTKFEPERKPRSKKHELHRACFAPWLLLMPKMIMIFK